MTRSSTAIGVLLGVALSGCHHFQRYDATPAPSADSSALAYAARSLEDPFLHEFLAAAGVPHDQGPWLPQQLTLVALYYRPDIMAHRAEIAAADTAVAAAGARPGLGVDLIPEKAARADEGKSSTWTVELGLDLTIEMGGKRGARVARARAALVAALLDARVHVWEVAGDVANAAAAMVVADSVLVAADSSAAAGAHVVDRVRERYDRGEVRSAELTRSLSDLADAKIVVTDAEHTRTNARIALARVMGLSPDRILDLAVVPTAPSCSMLDSVAVDSLRTRALRTRVDIGGALARYLQSETDLRLAIAEQYPDVHLGPAFLWDEGIARWLLTLGVPDLIAKRARGTIAEARAQRAMAAARVVVVQDSVLSDVDAAVAACHVSQHGLMAADSLVHAIQEGLTSARRSYDQGESGMTELVLAAFAGARAMHAIWDARARQDAAGLALQHAVGSWLTGPPVLWPEMRVGPLHENSGL